MAAAQAHPPHNQRHEGSLRTGDLVSAYCIERLLGAGGMGWVYRARHTIEDRVVALKVLREDQVRQDRAIDRMMREAQILATVAHGGIPQFFECGLLDDGRPWIAMELIDGTPLSVRLAEGAMHHEVVAEIIASIAGVLAAAHHRGVTHRDLKPDNILLTPTDPVYPLRVIDWGIAHEVSGARYTRHDETIGTPTYMAPEQARGGPTDGYSDVYGLGIVAYQALAGKPPFIGPSSVDILVQHLNRPLPPLAPRCPEAPIGLVELVERMLAKHYEERPTAMEVQVSLCRLRAVCGAAPVYLFYADDNLPALPREAPEPEQATVSMRPSLLRG